MQTVQKKGSTLTWTAATSLGLLLAGCTKEDDTGAEPYEFSETAMERMLRHEFDGTILADSTNAVADNSDAARLGQYLFFDTELSADGQQSCATCHQPEHGFSDPEPLSTAIGTTQRHTPTLINVALNRWFYWDGRCDTLWCQAAAPLEDVNEHGTNRLAVAHRIHNDEEVATAYEALFGDLPDLTDADRFPANARPYPDDESHPEHVAWETMTEADQTAATVVFVNAAKAIAAYERTLIQTGSPFDEMLLAFQSGDSSGGSALSASAKQGASLFFGDGVCWACHSGPGFSNKEFHNIALPEADGIDNESGGRYDGIAALQANPLNSMGSYSDDPSDADLKLTYLVQSPEEIGSYKTPGLRNLLDTAPYMHGGHFATLTEVVQHYNQMDDRPIIGHREELLLPLFWTDTQVGQVVAFLESLQGAPLNPELLSQPESPL